MKELTDDQKKSIWTRLGALVGFSEKAEVKLADYVAKDGSTISIDDATQEVTSGQADGEYELEDGTTLVIATGKLDSIKDAPVAAADAAAPAVTETPDAAAAESAAMADLQKQIDDLKAAIDALTSGNAALTEANTTLSVQLADIEAKPADKKVTLSSHVAQDATPAQRAWARYQK
ncbi:hypothetical protein [Hymenobacter siberiensis]|uniref:hypothetical protein n=1 Tax=Hymenobacter siberiensis TaxID=2848396 RepID=UPI001C1E0E73|nr:hypothetical protein [Hymenobacter siberiensis]